MKSGGNPRGGNSLTGRDVDLAGRQSMGDFGRWEPIEAFTSGAQRLMEARVRGLLAEGHVEQARAALDEWVTSCTTAHLSALAAGE